MGDRCSLTIHMRKDDLPRFAKAAGEDLEFLKNCVTIDDRSGVVLNVEEANYGWIEERENAAKAGISFVGGHDAGCTYSSCRFAAHGGKMIDITDVDGDPAVAVHRSCTNRQCVEPDPEDMRQVRDYYLLEDAAKAALAAPVKKKRRIR